MKIVSKLTKSKVLLHTNSMIRVYYRYSYDLAYILWSLTITLLCGGSNFTIQWHEWSDKPISRKRLLAGQINCNYWSAEKYFAPNLRFHEDCWRKRVEMNHGRLPHPLYRPRIFLLDWVFKSFFLQLMSARFLES